MATLTCLRSVGTNLTLTCPFPKSFVCNLPDSGRHVTSVFQGLSLLFRRVGRREPWERGWTLMGWHLSPRYGQVILVSGYPVLTAVSWSEHWRGICVKSSRALKLARKCGIEHWLACGADGRVAGGRAVYGYVITKFSGMVRFTYPWRSAGALSAPELCYNKSSQIKLITWTLSQKKEIFKYISTELYEA